MIEWERLLLAVSAAGIAVMSLAYGDFAPAWKAFPDWVPARPHLIELFALLLLTASIGLVIPRTRPASVAAIGAYYGLWAVIASAPIFANPLGVGAWYGTMEALTALAGTLVFLKKPAIPARPIRIVVGVTCVFYGWSHFVYAGFTAAMVPAWLPLPLVLAYVTGACHMAAGVGLISGVLWRLAATLEAAMMSLFGLLVWVPSFFADPTPKWATPPQNQWSELVVTLVLAAALWSVRRAEGGPDAAPP